MMARYGKNRAMTLVELLVAMTVSIVMMGAAYYIAKSEFNFTQNQQEVMDALKTARLALHMIDTDMESAGFMATPDASVDLGGKIKDPEVCAPFPVPSGGKRPVAIQFERLGKSGSPSTSPYIGNLNGGIVPMSVILMGAYPSHSVFRTDHIQGANVYLQNTPDFPTQQEFQRIFATNHLLRIVNQVNKMMFFRISNTHYAQRMVSLTQAVPSSSGECGIAGFGIGLAVNVVSFIRYRIKVNQNVQNPNITAVLVREELDPFNNWSVVSTIPIAHDVVDLQFYDFILDLDASGTDPDLSPFHGSSGNPYTLPESILNLAPATPAAYLGSSPTTALSFNHGPKDLRLVTIKLSTRTRDEDPSISYKQSGAGTSPGQHKPINYFDTDPNMQGLARVVSLVSKVDFSNLAARNMK